jgi:hypothetical protein
VDSRYSNAYAAWSSGARITTARARNAAPRSQHFYSLIESAKLAGVGPHTYLRAATNAALRGDAFEPQMFVDRTPREGTEGERPAILTSSPACSFASSKSLGALNSRWAPHDVRNEVVDFARDWALKTRLAEPEFIRSI